jgi:hypothetical protein
MRQAVRVISEEKVTDLMRTAFASLVRPAGGVSITDEHRLLL